MIIQANLYGKEYLVYRKATKTGVYLVNINTNKEVSAVVGKIDLQYILQGNKIAVPDFITGALAPSANRAKGEYIPLDMIEKVLRDVLHDIKIFDVTRGYYTTDDIRVEVDSKRNILSGQINLNAVKLDIINFDQVSMTQKSLDAYLSTGQDILTNYTYVSTIQKTLADLEREGFTFDWYRGENGWVKKDYVSVQTEEDILSMVRDFIAAHKKWIANGRPRKRFLVTLDFEATGVNAFRHREEDTVYLGVSFDDHKAYGIFINMEYHDNAPLDVLQEYFNEMFSRNLKVELEDDMKTIMDYTFCRGDIVTVAHNMSIDVRFGLKVDLDLWVDLCTQQLAFNMVPDFVRGHNGAKEKIKQVLGIEYPDLEAITGSYTDFKYIQDKETLLLYGSADVDLLRLYAYHLIDVIENEGYKLTGYNQLELYNKYDRDINNMIARMDYKGFRVNVAKAEQLNKEAQMRVDVLTKLMSKKLGMYLAYKAINLTLSNSDVTGQVSIPDIYAMDYPLYTTWSGDILEKYLFTDLDLPTLVYTKSKKKWSNKLFKYTYSTPAPALDKDAIEQYLDYKNIDQDKINKMLSEPVASIEHLYYHAKYLVEDVLDPVTPYDKDGLPNYLIKKDEFNTYAYPFFKFLQVIGPLQKDITTDFKRIIESGGYVSSESKLANALTRRILNGLQTTSGHNKYLYIGYTDDHNIVGVDQSTVEIRIAAALSKDKEIITPLKNPETDVHTALASDMLGKPPEDITKSERGDIKSVHFGRIYDRSVWSICSQIKGKVNSINLALTQKLVGGFDTARATLRQALADIAIKLSDPIEVPERMRFLFNLDTNPYYESRYEKGVKMARKFGMTVTTFGWTKFAEIVDEEPSRQKGAYRQGLNVGVQGNASTLLRIIVARLYIAAFKLDWIQNEYFMPHLTIYDELQSSYHKGIINPIYLAVVFNNCLEIDYDPFELGPDYTVPLFVGFGVGESWGIAKSDAAEVPVRLVHEWVKEVEQGMHTEVIEMDHYKYIQEKIFDYKIRRIREVLTELNNSNKWDMDKLTRLFTNYKVLGYIYEVVKPVFTVKYNDDPIEKINAIVPAFISKYMTTEETPVHLIASRGKVIKISNKFYNLKFASETDMYDRKPLKEEVTEDVVFDTSAKEDFAYMDFDYTSNYDLSYSEEDDIIRIDYFGLQENTYYTVDENGKIIPAQFSSLKVKEEEAQVKAHGYRITNGNIFIKRLKTMKWLEDWLEANKTTRSGQINIYSSLPGSKLKLHGSITEDKLPELEKKYKEVEDYLISIRK